MKYIFFKNLFLVTSLFLATNLSAQNKISGTITDSNSEEALIGASVLISGTSVGTVTDVNGQYSLSSDQKFPWTIQVTYTGYEVQTFEITRQGTVDLKMLPGLTIGNDIIISASRRREKVVDAVASVSVLNTEKIESIPLNSDVNELVRNIAGVNIVKGGTQFSNIELRGTANVNETNTLIMRDFAPITAISDKRGNTSLSSANAIDIARVEIIRGPSGALFGPNVTSGVVHYISKDPFMFTGTDVQLGIGEQNLFTSAIRHAGNINGKLGYKFVGTYNQSQDFKLKDLVSSTNSPVVVPQNFVDVEGNSVLENVENLDQDLSSWSAEATLEYRFSENLSIAYVGGLSRFVGNYRNQTSHLFNGEQRLDQQLRVKAGDLFVSAYWRHNFGNVDESGKPTGLANHIYSFNYATAPDNAATPEIDPQTSSAFTANNYYDISAQYNFEIGQNTQAVFGGDFKITPASINQQTFGINSKDGAVTLADGETVGGDNSYKVYGAYLSLKHQFTDKLSLNAAGRYDQFVAYKQGGFSPRLGMVYKPNPVSAIRVSFSRSLAAESQSRTWLDFVLPTPPIFAEIHAVGVAQPITFDNPVTQFLWGTIEGGESYQLADIINALAMNAEVQVDASNVSGTVNPTIVATKFQGAAPPPSGGIGNPLDPIGTLDNAGQGKPTLREVNQFEVGFSTILNEKIAINADVYYNITNNLQPQGIVSVTPGATLDLVTLENQIRDALPNADPAAVDAMIAQLNATFPNPTANPDLTTATGYGLILSDRAQALGYKYDVGFPTYGKKSVHYLGLDIGITYYFKPELSAFANYSYVSKNVWSPEDLGEVNPNFDFYLNTPKHRYNVGASYLQSKGIYGMIAMNGISEYEGKQGDGRIFTGTNEARTIFDASIGYRFAFGKNTKLDLGLTANNVFDTAYTQFIHMPEVRRLVSFNAKVHFGE